MTQEGSAASAAVTALMPSVTRSLGRRPTPGELENARERGWISFGEADKRYGFRKGSTATRCKNRGAKVARIGGRLFTHVSDEKLLRRNGKREGFKLPGPRRFNVIEIDSMAPVYGHRVPPKKAPVATKAGYADTFPGTLTLSFNEDECVALLRVYNKNRRRILEAGTKTDPVICREVTEVDFVKEIVRRWVMPRLKGE